MKLLLAKKYVHFCRDLYVEEDRMIPEVLVLMAETYISDAHALEDFPHFPGVILPDDLGYNLQFEIEVGKTKIIISKIVA